MGEVFITRKGGGGKTAAPTITITEAGGTWIELEITNNDAAVNPATIFVLANYDPTSETDFDLQASQNGFVFAVAEGETVTQFVTGLDPDTSHTVSASAAVIKKLPSSVVTTDSTDLAGTGVTAPSLGPLVENNPTTSVITVTNNDTNIPLVIKANVTTSTTAPTTYPFETASLAVGATTNLTITGLTPETTFYIHARAFDGAFSSSNVVFGPYTTSIAVNTLILNTLGTTDRTLTAQTIVVDCRSSVSVPGTLQIIANGGRGGVSSGNSSPGNGWNLTGNVPYSALAGKIIGFVGGSNGVQSTRNSRDSGGGGGFSGIIELDPTGFQQLKTLTHIFTAGGGGGSGTNSNGQVNSTLVTSGTPVAGAASLHKASNASTGAYPSFTWAQRPGNAWGGGDSSTNENGDDNYQGGGGGGFGPLPGGASNNSAGPGVLSGIPSQPPHNFFNNAFGGYGGGGTGSGGGNGGTAWRTTAGGGGGGGFIAGAGGGYVGDGSSRGGFGGSAFTVNSAWVVSSSSTGSTSGSLRIIL